MSTSEIIARVRGQLGPQHLRADWRKRRPATATPSWGCCYVAAEAVYHAAGGAASGLRPTFVRHEDAPHWYLVGPAGEIFDPTADQFSTRPDYSFLTSAPSARARRILAAI